MSFERTVIDQLRRRMSGLWPAEYEAQAIVAGFDACLAEIDRLASAEYAAEVVQQLRVAVDVLLTKIDRQGPGFQKLYDTAALKLERAEAEIERLTAYASLLEHGLGAHEARETIWPQTSQS